VPGELFFPSVHQYEVIKYPFVFDWLLAIDDQHFLGSLCVNKVTVFGVDKFFLISVEQLFEVIEIDIFNINPLNLEIVLELVIEVAPPVGKGIRDKSRGQSGYSFKHSALHHCKK
jgi:hypothetical protein